MTEGLLRTLSRDELQGVVAHEMAHVQNLDVRLMTLLAGMVGAIALMSDGMGRMLRGGRAETGGGGGGRSGRGKGGNPLALVVLVLWLLTLVRGADRLADPRDGGEPEAGVPGRRDRRAVHPQSDGAGLRAREARGRGRRPPRPSPAARPISASWTRRRGCFAAREGFFADALASHPPIRQRIARLQGMGYQQANGASRAPARDQPALPPATGSRRQATMSAVKLPGSNGSSITRSAPAARAAVPSPATSATTR